LAKNLKLNIKNAQIASAVNLSSLKDKLAQKKASVSTEPQEEVESKKVLTGTTKARTAPIKKAKTEIVEEPNKEPKEEIKRKARSRSAFAEPDPADIISKETDAETYEESSLVEDLVEPIYSEISDIETISTESESFESESAGRRKSNEELRQEIFGEEIRAQQQEKHEPTKSIFLSPTIEQKESHTHHTSPTPLPAAPVARPHTPSTPRQPQRPPLKELPPLQLNRGTPREFVAPTHKLGPTGKHIKDFAPPPRQANAPTDSGQANAASDDDKKMRSKVKPKAREGEVIPPTEDSEKKNAVKTGKFKEFKDVKPAKRQEQTKFDVRDKQGLRITEEESHWRKKRFKQARHQQEDITIRPTSLKVRIPISIKDLAVEMKLKASQLVAKLFSQGIVATLNDLLEDETTIQLLGHEFACEIQIDSTEEERIRITDKTIKEEVQGANPENLIIRPPVVAFMGHVDHGKTSLIDAIRKTNRASGEAGAITQHIGAFLCSTAVGNIAILDTPGHEAFSAMRARGADITDIVVLVVAGDEGLKLQTVEAINHAKAAKVTIVVAINKCDKPNFNVENVYRQLSEIELLPEAWGGQTITINCSAVTGEGVPQLLEMLALQAEILELKADPTTRARGTVLESEMHKGMGSIATVLVQNGTLRLGDALVFGQHWGRVKTMRDEYDKQLQIAGPSTPIEITGLSGLPEAGEEFIVVKSEKEARAIAEARMQGMRQVNLLQAKKISMDNIFQQASETQKKILNIVIRADVQGSLEALKTALMKIQSTKAELNIVSATVGEVSESDVQLAATSKAVILGFHTQVESHADALLKELGVQIKLHDIIYHAIDDVKVLMSALLDKIAQETEKGKAEVKAIFKSSQLGNIIGSIVIEGSVHRAHSVRLRRGKEIVWKGGINSLKRVKEDVREVQKGLECGIVLNNFNDALEGDIIETYEVTYITQEL